MTFPVFSLIGTMFSSSLIPFCHFFLLASLFVVLNIFVFGGWSTKAKYRIYMDPKAFVPLLYVFHSELSSVEKCKTINFKNVWLFIDMLKC